MSDEEDVTPEERREAEALARALERGHGGPDLSEDALEAAHLLQYSKDDGTLSAERSDAILAEALEGTRQRSTEARRPWWRWLVGLTTLGAAAAGALFWLRPGLEPQATELPAPPVEVLRAQLRVASSELSKVAELDGAMGGYRVAVYDSLEGRYGR